jgi:DNA-binding NtrC family response regulator
MYESRIHVLLIEDNPGDADLVRLRLDEGKEAIDLSCVARLEDALAAIDKDFPALVLLDLNLPDSRGPDTLRKLLAKAPGVPVVIISGQDDEAIALNAVLQGVPDFMVKGDITTSGLERVIHGAIERRALLRSTALLSYTAGNHS